MEAFIGSILVVPFTYAPVGWSMCAGQLLQVNQMQALFSLIGNIYGGTANSTFALPDLRGRSVVGAFADGAANPAASYQLGAVGGSLTASVSQVVEHSHVTVSTLALNSATAQGAVSVPVSASFTNQTVTVKGTMPATTEPGSADAPFNGATMADLNPGTSPKIYALPSTDPTKTVQLAPVNSTGQFSATSTGTAAGTINLAVTGSLSGTVTVQPAGGGPVSVPTVGPFLALNNIIATTGLWPQRD